MADEKIQNTPPIHPLITVREIAKRVRRDDEDLIVVLNRLRNWTKEGLLPPIGDKHPGAGKARYYPQYAAVDAAVIGALAAAGIPAVRAGSAIGAYSMVLQQARGAYYREFQAREVRSETIFLIINGADGGPIYDSTNPNRAYVTTAAQDRMNARFNTTEGDVHLVVNLSNLFRRIEKKTESIGEN
jgi:hypothetical protein